MSESLAAIYEKHRVHGPDVGMGDKGGTHSYIETYDRLLTPYRSNGKFTTLMEIGLAMGLSLAMWREYMSKATIIGVDLSIVFDPKPHTDTGTILIAADATKPDFPFKLGVHSFDVVIDDGSHMCADQCETFRLLKPRMREGSIYCIEDVLNLESALPHFLALHDKVEVFDLRAVKGRFDDVIICFRF